MLANSISLPEAYIHLHLQSKRDFFVFAHDLPFLRKVEERILHEHVATYATSPALGSSLSVPPALKWKGGWSLGSWTWKEDGPASITSGLEAKERREAAIEKHAVWFNVRPWRTVPLKMGLCCLTADD